MGNLGPVQLLIILLLVLLVFGTKRIRSLGSDLGGAIRDFRKGVSDDGSGEKPDEGSTDAASRKDTPSGSEPNKD
jgi:sec-independent protein translocase protein TatA